MTRCRGKRRYETPGAASRVVDMARDKRKQGHMARNERRVYRCRVCKGWHVTSEDYRESEAA